MREIVRKEFDRGHRPDFSIRPGTTAGICCFAAAVLIAR
jgi:hypothetical protein